MRRPDYVILADGDFPSHPIPMEILRETERLYCCDHAGAVALQKGLKPIAIVGDGDSLTDEQKIIYGNLFHQVDEQDYNDLTKTLRKVLIDWETEKVAKADEESFLMAKVTSGAKDEERLCVAFLGTTGKREDHTLCNISLMMWYYRNFPVYPILITNYGCFLPATGRTQFDSFTGQQVSIFNFGCTRLESAGLKWQSYAYEEFWQGGLNEALGDTFTLDGDKDYLVYLTYDAKC